MNPDTLRDEAESLRTDPRGLGVYAGRVRAHAEAWDVDIEAHGRCEGHCNNLSIENIALRQRYDTLEADFNIMRQHLHEEISILCEENERLRQRLEAAERNIDSYRRALGLPQIDRAALAAGEGQ